MFVDTHPHTYTEFMFQNPGFRVQGSFLRFRFRDSRFRNQNSGFKYPVGSPGGDTSRLNHARSSRDATMIPVHGLEEVIGFQRIYSLFLGPLGAHPTEDS